MYDVSQYILFRDTIIYIIYIDTVPVIPMNDAYVLMYSWESKDSNTTTRCKGVQDCSIQICNIPKYSKLFTLSKSPQEDAQGLHPCDDAYLELLWEAGWKPPMGFPIQDMGFLGVSPALFFLEAIAKWPDRTVFPGQKNLFRCVFFLPGKHHIRKSLHPIRSLHLW